MRLAIMQPYFFPYLGYFALINSTEKWVVFDTVQYINKGWINRNRILSNTEGGVGYITVPVVKESRDMLIKDTIIHEDKKWRQKIMGQLDYYKKGAPHFRSTKNLVDEIINYQTDKISELNIFGLKRTCEYLGINFNYSIFSQDTLGIHSVNEPDEWALEISKKLNANMYINPPGGKDFFDIQKYKSSNVDLKFLTINLRPFKTNNYPCILGLSIIDVMMFNAPLEIKKMLEDYALE